MAKEKKKEKIKSEKTEKVTRKEETKHKETDTVEKVAFDELPKKL